MRNKKETYQILETWYHHECKSMGEALNNPNLNRIKGEHLDKKEAERLLKFYEELKHKDIVYRIERCHCEKCPNNYSVHPLMRKSLS